MQSRRASCRERLSCSPPVSSSTGRAISFKASGRLLAVDHVGDFEQQAIAMVFRRGVDIESDPVFWHGTALLRLLYAICEQLTLSRNWGSSQLAEPRDSHSIRIAGVGSSTRELISFSPVGEPPQVCDTSPGLCPS